MEAGRHSSHTAAAPTSQVSAGTIGLSAVTPKLNPLPVVAYVSSSVARPNSTVEQMRAQFWPWLCVSASGIVR